MKTYKKEMNKIADYTKRFKQSWEARAKASSYKTNLFNYVTFVKTYQANIQSYTLIQILENNDISYYVLDGRDNSTYFQRVNDLSYMTYFFEKRLNENFIITESKCYHLSFAPQIIKDLTNNKDAKRIIRNHYKNSLKKRLKLTKIETIEANTI